MKIERYGTLKREEGRGFVDQTHDYAVCFAQVEEMEKTAVVGGDSAGCSAVLDGIGGTGEVRNLETGTGDWRIVVDSIAGEGCTEGVEVFRVE